MKNKEAIMEDEKKIMSIVLEDGTIDEVEVLLSFKFTDTNTEYMVYTKNETDDNKVDKNNKNKKSIKLLSSSGIIEINNKFSSIKKMSDLSKTKSPIFESRKIKKKEVKLNKQLNKISKNIQNTSKNINNPEEFYMNFFNNILAKETKSFNGDENDYKTKSNKLIFQTGIKKKENNFSQNNDNVEFNAS